MPLQGRGTGCSHEPAEQDPYTGYEWRVHRSGHAYRKPKPLRRLTATEGPRFKEWLKTQGNYDFSQEQQDCVWRGRDETTGPSATTVMLYSTGTLVIQGPNSQALWTRWLAVARRIAIVRAIEGGQTQKLVGSILNASQAGGLLTYLRTQTADKLPWEHCVLLDLLRSCELCDTGAECSVIGDDIVPLYTEGRETECIEPPADFIGGIDAMGVGDASTEQLLAEGKIQRVLRGLRVYVDIHPQSAAYEPLGTVLEPLVHRAYIDYAVLHGAQPAIMGLPDMSRNRIIPFVAAGVLMLHPPDMDCDFRGMRVADIQRLATLHMESGALYMWSKNLHSKVLRLCDGRLPDLGHVGSMVATTERYGNDPAGRTAEEQQNRKMDILRRCETESRRQLLLAALDFSTIVREFDVVFTGEGFLVNGLPEPPVWLKFALPWCNAQKLAAHATWAEAQRREQPVADWMQHQCLFPQPLPRAAWTGAE